MNTVMVEPIVFEPLQEAGIEGRAVGPDLSMVGHVQVRITAILGEAELPLSELFALKAGHVMELDRLLDEPVTISLHGQPVATAHLVAVGDRFGVQIVQVFGQA